MQPAELWFAPRLWDVTYREYTWYKHAEMRKGKKAKTQKGKKSNNFKEKRRPNPSPTA